MTPGPVTFTLSAPAGTSTTAQWADLDVAGIAAQLKQTGVYAPADQQPGLQQVVDRAATDGHHLHLVVLEQSYSPFTVYRDIATELQSQVGGTVLVMGASGMGTASDEFSRVELEDASNEVKAGSSAESAASQIYDRAIAPHADWTLVTLGLILVAVLGAIIARVTMLRRRAVDGGAGASADGASTDNRGPETTAAIEDDAQDAGADQPASGH